MGEIAEALRRAREAKESRISPDRVERLRREDKPVLPPASSPPLESRGTPLPVPDAPLREPQADGPQRCELPPPGDGRVTPVPPHSPAAERFRQFAVKVRAELEARKRHGVMVTSPIQGDGKTFTAVNLAVALASISAGRSVALVEFDLRRPSLRRVLGLSPQVGMAEVLAGGASLDEACLRAESHHLDLYVCDEPSAGAHELLAAPRLAEVTRTLLRSYDLVVFDTPPLLPVPDVGLICPHVGAALCVVRMGSTRMGAVNEMLSSIPESARLGLFLNDCAGASGSDYYDRYEAGDAP